MGYTHLKFKNRGLVVVVGGGGVFSPEKIRQDEGENGVGHCRVSSRANWKSSVSWKPEKRSRSRKRQKLTPSMLLRGQRDEESSTGFHQGREQLLGVEGRKSVRR